MKCEPSQIQLLSMPPQQQCKNCGQTWYVGKETPDCLRPKEQNSSEPTKPWEEETMKDIEELNRKIDRENIILNFDRDFREYLDASIAYAEAQVPYRPIDIEDEIKWLKNYMSDILASLSEKGESDEEAKVLREAGFTPASEEEISRGTSVTHKIWPDSKGEELRPMTEGEKELARGLDEAFAEEDGYCGDCGSDLPSKHE